MSYRGFCPIISKTEPVECWGTQCQWWLDDDCVIKQMVVSPPIPPSSNTNKDTNKNIYKGV